MPAGPNIQLTRQQQATGYVNNKAGFRMIVTAVGQNGIDSNVFRYLRRPKNPAEPTGEREDVFDGIVTLEELASLPIGSPDENDEPQYMRLDTVDNIYASQDLALSGWENIQNDCKMLTNAYRASQVLGASETVTVVNDGA